MTPTEAQPAEMGRSAQKRQAIIQAATELFLERGYGDTSMDQVAARAAVSKQTVYKQFADKERLFAEVVLGISGTVEAFIDDVAVVLGSTHDVAEDLGELARVYIRSVMQPRMLQLRRLLIGEVRRFPELGRGYYETGPGRVIRSLSQAFRQLTDRGLLYAPDPEVAAQHFALLVVGIPLDRAMVLGDSEAFSETELNRLAEAGAQAFLAAYGPKA